MPVRYRRGMTTSVLDPPGTRHGRAAAALDRYRELDAAVSRLQAQRLRALAEFARYGGSARSVIAEAALEIRMSEKYLGSQLALAQALDTRLPHTQAAMGRGELNEYEANAVAELTAPLSDEQARQVDQILALRLKKKHPRDFRGAVRRIVHNVDPDGTDRRAKAKRADRNVSLIHQDDTMATLLAKLPVEQASAIYSSVDLAAKALRKNDKTRTLDQLRADVFAERLLAAANGDASLRPLVYVYVDLLTLIGLNETPGYLPGHGPIPAWLARTIATDPKATWTRLITDADTGQLLSVGRTKYRPPADLDEFVRVRARTCQTPGCNRPAQFSDIDHTTGWAHGGETSADDLRGRCEHHHYLKDEPGWRYEAGPGGSTTITTPHGRTYTSEPEPFHEPRSADPSPG